MLCDSEIESKYHVFGTMCKTSKTLKTSQICTPDVRLENFVVQRVFANLCVSCCVVELFACLFCSLQSVNGHLIFFFSVEAASVRSCVELESRGCVLVSPALTNTQGQVDCV